MSVAFYTMIGKNEKMCLKNETLCPECNGSTVGDYGQPFECESCSGTGSISVFECKILN
jgi:DnaJ-class molecular chaperone